MVKIGMMLGDRYEILEKIGTGGMSDVYKAKCHKLNRYVAIKVLKQEFSENTNFVSKFRVEAQAAASMMHPNIVNVYDVGEDNGIHYIVMELVEGITLKKYIEKKARLSVKEAVSIAIQACMGIEAAHNNHIIHRDIKPQNIMISKEGKVKVTDFGIAKAATSNTITSNVMGSVHYTSPEQARGGYSDEKSDIYSMGITLFEMLTGRVPFNGDTTVAIAIKHIQENIPCPRDFVPEIPASVEQIVLKCTQKSPDRRYQSMGVLIEDLKKSLIAPDEDFVQIINPDENAATRTISNREVQQIKKQARKNAYPQEEVHLKKNDSGQSRGGSAKSSKNQSKKKPPVYEPDDEDDEEDGYESKMERMTTVLAVIGAIVIGCVVIFLVGRAIGVFGTDGNKDEITMIDVLGLPEAEAKEKLEALGLKTEVSYETSDTVEIGNVISTDVKKGAVVPNGSKVVLSVSGAEEGVDVPNVVGKTLAEAVSLLQKEGFKVEKKEGFSDTVAENNIASQSPEGGAKAERGATITITISRGPENSKVKVPDVLGLSLEDGKAVLTAAGLLVRNVEEVNKEDEALIGKICSQSYSVGTEVEPGTSIDLEVSIGPKASSYMYEANVESPAVEEPSYVPGTQCVVSLVGASGTELYHAETNTFPMPMKVTGIKGDSAGVLNLTFMITTDATTTTDPETGETITIPGKQEPKVIQRIVQFTEEAQ